MPTRFCAFVISHLLLALGNGSCFSAVVAPIAGDAGPLPTTIDDNCRRRFMTEALPAWNQLKERLLGLELELTFLDHRPDDKEHDGAQWSFTYCRLRDGVSRQLHRDDKVDVTNSQYSFKVSASDNGYHLSECELWQANQPQPLVGWIEDIESKLTAGSSIWLVPLTRVIADKNFVMTGADCGVNDAGDEVVRVVYRYSDKESVDYALQPDALYWAELLPKRFWVAARSGVISSPTEHFDTDVPFRVSVKTRFQDWDDAPLPEEVRYEVVDTKRNVVVRVHETHVGVPRTCKRSVEEFFLPSFGISESSVPRLEGRSLSRWYGVFGTGIAILILLWLLIRRAGKSSY